jgi:MarR family.
LIYNFIKYLLIVIYNGKYCRKKIRLDNQMKVLNAILDAGGITRNALAKSVGVSLMTITNVVDDLIAMGLLSEKKCDTRVGRTPARLYFSHSESVILGLDLTSKTGADFMLYNLQKVIVHQGHFDFSNDDYESNLLGLCEGALTAAKENGLKIVGVGVSLPGVYNPVTDTVMSSLIVEQCKIKLKNF